MDTKTQIEERARTLFPVLNQHIMECNGDYMLEEGFRFVYLILKHPYAFLQAFKTGKLKIDEALVDECYWNFRFDLPGPSNLTADEREIIRNHNLEVDKIASPGLRSVVTGLAPSRMYG